MTRRSFLKNIAGALAVLALPVAVKAAAEERLLGVRFVDDPYPARFNYVDGRYVYVKPILDDGVVVRVNPAWVNADCELETWVLPSIF